MPIIRMTYEEALEALKNRTPEEKEMERQAMLREPDLTDPDHPEATEEMFAKATRPGRVDPEMKKVLISVRVDPKTAAKVKSTGRNWSTRAGNILQQAFV